MLEQNPDMPVYDKSYDSWLGFSKKVRFTWEEVG